MWSFSLISPFLLACALSTASVFAEPASNSTITATFSNSLQWKFDTNGNAIDSTSGKIDFLNGQYIWYGISHGCGGAFCGILSWSSPDLQTWHPNGYLFDPNTTEIQKFCGGELTGNCGRPHIVYSETTKTYVLWVNANYPGYALFTSTSLTSGYTLSPNRALVGYQPSKLYMAGDFSVEIIDGTGYLVYSLIDFTTLGASIWPPFLQSLYIQPLTPDLTNTTGNVTHVISSAGDLVDFEAESPDIFKRGPYFYITASNTCKFCTGTLLLIYRSTSITGPWTRQILSGDTCGGQTTGVLTLPSPYKNSTASYLHQADLFSTAPTTGTRTAAHAHAFQLLSFNNTDGSVADLVCASKHTSSIPITPGTLPTSNTTTTTSLTPTDSSPSNTPYTATCPLPTTQLYQTWTTSKTGLLTTVGLNIASNTPTANLTLTVFRFSNNSNLYTPRYIWETLATISIPPTDLSQAFKVVSVSVNATVTEGDRLGVAVVSEGITPVCVLMAGGSSWGDVQMGTVPGGERNLFANGLGQVSLRGMGGGVVPVGVMGGQVRWFAVVE